MSVAAVLLVKDEEDIIEPVLRHLAYHVDEIIVADNRSTDATMEILQLLRMELDLGSRLVVRDDAEVGYFQDRKTTGLAMLALDRGHQWVVPCDADEIWHAGPVNQPIREFLGALNPDVMIVRAGIYNHLSTVADDPEELNPILRMGWRKRWPNGVKVACRLRQDLRIEMGNHSAVTDGGALAIEGLNVRHFSFRSRDQYARKVINGARAYAKTDYPENVGIGWRMFGEDPDPEMLREHFDKWFHLPSPEADDSLIFDPAPLQPPAISREDEIGV